jgi:uncharacterized protein YcsI (UPF0317 family)
VRPIAFEDLRGKIRRGEFRGTTSGLCPGRVQANVAILPAHLAPDFRTFCERNPRPCPLLEEAVAGEVSFPRSAPTADVRTDVPLYRVYARGKLVAEEPDILARWRDDLVTFLLGCSFTFEHALARAGIPLRHQREGKTVPMYVTAVPTEPAGVFAGPLVVSMRPVPRELVDSAIEISARYPLAHGAPIHAGDPAGIGIRDLMRPDYGDAVSIAPEEVPLFWACGVTPQAVALQVAPELLITHAPGSMFLTDLVD